MTEKTAHYTTSDGLLTLQEIKASRSLLPFNNSEYEPPTPDEIKTVIAWTEKSSAELARYLGISEPRTVRRWKEGKPVIPYAAWRLLLLGLELVKPQPIGDVVIDRGRKAADTKGEY